MTVKINDISDKGQKRTKSKALRYEVGVLHTVFDDEPLDVAAKFRCYGDAWRFAKMLSEGNVYFSEIIIR